MSEQEKATGECSADTILGWLLDPPSVPDSAWYARAGAILLQSFLKSPAAILTSPTRHRPCERFMKILCEGTFRSQSTVLDALNSAIEMEEFGFRKWHIQDLQKTNDTGTVLSHLSSEAGLPALSAALCLCGDQQRDNDAAPPIATANAPAAFIQQQCCEDPYDCEEPAVREAALHLVALLCATVAAALDEAPANRTAPATSADAAVAGTADTSADGDEDAAAEASLCMPHAASPVPWRGCALEYAPRP